MVTASRDFQVFVKPGGARCNLDCRYCYYVKRMEGEGAFCPPAEPPRMPDAILEAYIAQHIAASPAAEIRFSWHGGEPLLLGRDFFRQVLSLQRRHQPRDRRIANGLQTNGTLLDEDWGRFLAAAGFAVGISLDGPVEMHDRYRLTRGGNPTHGEVLRGYEILRRHRIPCDILCVVHRENVRRPLEVYRFFKGIDARHISFLPLVEPLSGGASLVSDRTVPAEAWCMTTTILMILLGATTTFAENTPKMKMSTTIPPGIEMPNKVETRLGTLNFFDGFPDNASVEKLYDNLDFQRAVQAYLLAPAPVNQVANRKGIREVGPDNITVPIFETMMNARSIFLTPNNNTPYTWFWLDLRNGPLVLEVPPKVLGLIDDMWYHFVTDVGIVGPDKGEGGKYLLLPPGYKGEVPEGYFVVRPATFSVWVPWRTFLENGDPKPGVDRVKKFTKIYPLSQAANPPALNFVNVSGRDFNTDAPADYPFWEYLNQVVQEEPTDSIDPITLGYWASIGIKKGKPFNPDARMKKILTEAALVGDATVRAVMYRWRTPEGYYYPDTKSAWRLGFIGGYKFEENGARILDAYSGFFFYATGVTPAMDSKMVGQGSQYMAAFVDAKGNPLDGGKNYKLHLPPNIPVANFWSVILYDNQTRAMLQTNQQWPAVSSQTKGLQVNPDSSVDIYFGPNAPKGKESNWVQTVPGKGWNTLLRLYGPLQPWFDKTWRPGEIELVN